MIPRSGHLDELQRLLRGYPVVAILGPRQTGKTTLARAFAAGRPRVTFFDLEDAAALAQLGDPMLALGPLRGLVVIDEVQLRPDLFRTMRVLADRPRTPARFLVLGSASPSLLRQSSETLAGRIAFHELPGFSLDEVGERSWERLWLRGGFPRSFLARSDGESLRWREEFIRTFLSRDLPSLGLRLPAATMRRFWTMLAHWHGRTWNGSELARAFGVSDTTVRHYLDVLQSALVVRTLPPWHENLTKRQIRSPKPYIADSGLLHALLRIPNRNDLLAHPAVGASWEGYAIQAVIQRFGLRDEVFCWGTHGGAELDMLVVRGTKRWGFEFKRSTAPTLTPSMRTALTDLKLRRLDVIHAGDRTYKLAQRVTAIPLRRLAESAPLT